MGSPVTGIRFQAIGPTGILPFAEVETYAAGTLTPLPTYTNEGLGTPNPTTVLCDANGQADIWVGSAAYRFRVYTATAFGRTLVYDRDNYKGPGAVTSDMLASLAASGGAGLVGSTRGTSGALTTTVRDRLNGGYVYLWPEFTSVTNGTTDVTTAVQNALNTGKSVIINVPITISTADVSTLGQMVIGLGRGVTDVIPVSGGKGFRFRARNTGICAMRFIPPGNVAGVQSSLVADCVTIQEAASDDNYIEGFYYDEISCENIKGAAIRMISPLRESTIQRFRWHGMGNSATGIGAFDFVNPSNTNRSPNNITILDGSVYRFAVPWLNFKVTDLGVVGRSEPTYAQIRIKDVLSHGQLVDENAVPSPLSVMPEQCDHIYIKGVEGAYLDNVVFSAVHPNYLAARIDSYPAYAINKSVSIARCYATYGLTVPAIPANVSGVVVGGATGGYFRVTDCIDLTMHDNHVAAGYFTYDLDARDSGAHASTLVSSFTDNVSINQFQPTINYPDHALILAPGSGKITINHTTPTVELSVPGGPAKVRVIGDGAGSVHIQADPTAAASASLIDMSVDGTVHFSLDKDGVISQIKYITWTARAAGTVPVQTQFLDLATGKMSFKDGTGTVTAFY